VAEHLRLFLLAVPVPEVQGRFHMASVRCKSIDMNTGFQVQKM
jgi:hypothetical protein